MGRIQMLHQDVGHAGIERKIAEQLGEGFQPSSRSSDSYNARRHALSRFEGGLIWGVLNLHGRSSPKVRIKFCGRACLNGAASGSRYSLNLAYYTSQEEHL